MPSATTRSYALALLLCMFAVPTAFAQRSTDTIPDDVRGTVYAEVDATPTRALPVVASSNSLTCKTYSYNDLKALNNNSVAAGTATLKLPADACPVEVNFTSYSLPGGMAQPFDKQVLYRNVTATYGPGTHTITVGLPQCTWQTDLYIGDIQSELTTGGHKANTLLHWDYYTNSHASSRQSHRGVAQSFAPVACGTPSTPNGFEDGNGGSSNQFAFACAANGGQGTSIDFYATGMGSNSASVNPAMVAIPNPSNVDYIIAQVTIKDEAAATVAFETAGEYKVLSAPTSSDAGKGFFYRVRLAGGTNIDKVTATVNTGGQGTPKNTPRALNLYVVRNGGNGNQAAGLFSEKDVFVNRTSMVSETIALPAANRARDITVTYALTDVQNDGRSVIVDVTAGGVTTQQTVTIPNNGSEAFLGSATLTGVPANVSNVVVKVTSPSGGDSVFLNAASATSKGDCFATIGDTVYNDDNRNGTQNVGETGIDGVKVTLTTPGADTTCGTSDDVFVADATTANGGKYLFEGLAPGAYCVTVDESGVAGKDLTTNNSPDAKTVTAGDNYLDADFGFATKRISPVLECVVNEGGHYRAFWGYNNPTGSQQQILIGSRNRFTTASNGDEGQPTQFAQGRAFQAFSTTFSSGATQTWVLDGKTSSASANSTPCKVVDLEVTKTVDNATPVQGDNVTFTIVLENKGPDAGEVVEVTDKLPTGLDYVSHTASRGTYAPGTGVWNLDATSSNKLPVGTSVLTITAKVSTPNPVTNIAQVSKSAKYDPDSTPGNGDANEDDQDSATVTPSSLRPKPTSSSSRASTSPRLRRATW